MPAATGALDDATEKALTETLAGLSRDLTIILIAHRLSTAASCDRVITVADAALRESRSVTTLERSGGLTNCSIDATIME